MWKRGSNFASELSKDLNRLVKKKSVNGRKLTITSVRKITHASSWESAKPFEDIPSALQLPLIGTAWQNMPFIGRYTLERQVEANRDKRKRLGNIFLEKFGPYHIVISFNLQDLESMIKSEGQYPSRSEMFSIKAYRESRKQWFNSPGLLNLQGKEWYELRIKTQKHILKPMAVYDYLEPMQSIAREFADTIYEIRDENKEVPDLIAELQKWTLESISLVGLDTRLACLKSDTAPDSDGNKIVRNINIMFDTMTKLEPLVGNLPIWKYISTPTWKKFVKASDEYTEIAFKYIKQSLKKLEDGENKKLTLLQAMIAQKDLDVSEAVLFVSDMILAGVETTSNAVGLLLYNLARNPEKQEILYQEITRLLPTDAAHLDPDTFESLKYLKACMNESLRVTPIIPGNARLLAKDTVLSGFKVPAGTFTAVFYDPIYRDDKIFKDAAKFLPERWLDRSNMPPKYSFIPFGLGPRSCIGKRLAVAELVSAIVEIVRKFRIEYHYEEVGMITRLLNIPDRPIKLKFVER